jgi:hypothetical protein
LPDGPYAADEAFAFQHLVASVRITEPAIGPDRRSTFNLPTLA